MPDFVDLKCRAFACRIGGNGAAGRHREGYNGVWSLTPTDQPDSIFVPEYAGLNLEHYFDGWHSGGREIFFEPRVAPMEVEQPDGRSVLLRQAATPFWGAESKSRFTLHEPNRIQLDFETIPRREVFNGGTMGVFWASYMNGPSDNAIYFTGQDGAGNLGVQRHSSPKHGDASSVRGTGDTLSLHISPEQRDKLFSSVTPVRWSRPYYWARWRDTAYLCVFSTPNTLRFAMSPSGGGPGNPAWDYQILVPGYRVGQTYSLTVHLVVDAWQGEAWIHRTAAQILAG